MPLFPYGGLIGRGGPTTVERLIMGRTIYMHKNMADPLHRYGLATLYPDDTGATSRQHSDLWRHLIWDPENVYYQVGQGAGLTFPAAAPADMDVDRGAFFAGGPFGVVEAGWYQLQAYYQVVGGAPSSHWNNFVLYKVAPQQDDEVVLGSFASWATQSVDEGTAPLGGVLESVPLNIGEADRFYWATRSASRLTTYELMFALDIWRLRAPAA